LSKSENEYRSGILLLIEIGAFICKTVRREATPEANRASRQAADRENIPTSFTKD
jgi:hypothetical protein